MRLTTTITQSIELEKAEKKLLKREYQDLLNFLGTKEDYKSKKKSVRPAIDGFETIRELLDLLTQDM